MSNKQNDFFYESMILMDKQLGMSIPQLLQNMPSAEEQISEREKELFEEDSVKVGGKVMALSEYDHLRSDELSYQEDEE